MQGNRIFGTHTLAIAERIRVGVAVREISLAPRPGVVRATISIGVATFPEDGGNQEELLDAADTALYRAKLAGRDSVSV